MSYLLKFSFGPVQDFIAAGRKLEDLMSGSAMLDKLMRKAQNIVIEGKGEVIYPVETGLVNCPNILLAACRTLDGRNYEEGCGLGLQES
jgi:hypothetical protein